MDSSLLTRGELATARPKDIGRLFNMERVHPVAYPGRIRTPMLIACGPFCHFVILEWDDLQELEYSTDPEWRAISKGLANGRKEYKLGMVRFGSVRFFNGFWRTLNRTIGSV